MRKKHSDTIGNHGTKNILTGAGHFALEDRVAHSESDIYA